RGHRADVAAGTAAARHLEGAAQAGGNRAGRSGETEALMDRQDKRRAVLVRIGSRIGWRLGVGWYGLTQRISEDDSAPVRPAHDYQEILVRLRFGQNYAPDPVHGKLDIMRHPRRIQRWIDTGKPIGDCDEHAA